MNKKIYIASILCLILVVFLSQSCYAKYVMGGNLSMNVYIDRTPPVIHLITNGERENYPTTDLVNIIKKTDDVKIDTTDNISIKYNEVYYNPTDSNFDGKTPERFDNGKTITDEGYYKIVAVDTSNNKTEIIILIDKSAPEVTVRYYKKSQISCFTYETTNLFGNGGAIC